MRLKLHRLALALAIALAPAHAQILHPSGPLPSYEVATIKPVDGAPPPSPGGPPPMPRDEMLRFVNTRILIASAYNAEAFARSEIIGGPSWLDSQIYEIHTKIGGPLSDAMQQISNAQRKKNMELMDQSLLADRFKLNMHFETRQLPQYALVAAKGSPKLAAAVNPSGPHNRSMQMPSGQNMELTATAVSTDSLASMLQMEPEIGGRRIVNRTGLTGLYDVTLDWTPNRVADTNPNAPVRLYSPHSRSSSASSW